MRLAMTFIVTIGVAAGASARAADWYTGVPTDGPVQPSVAVDVSVEGTSQREVAATVIGTIAPFAPLAQSGFRFRLGGLAGRYDYNSSTLGRVDGVMEGGSFLAGYEWVTPNASISAFLGADVTNNSLSRNDQNNPVHGSRGGAKMEVNFYVTPTLLTMISGVANYSTNHDAYYARAKFGYMINDQIYLGPEILALGDDFFQQWRIGGHATGFRFGGVQFGVSGGFLNDRVRGGGAYGILDTRYMF